MRVTSMDSPFTRLYQSTDALGVATLSQDWAKENITLGYEGDNVWSVESLTAKIDESDTLFWVAIHGDAVVGYVRGEILVDKAQPAIPAGERYLKVRELYVKKESRALGIGKALMQAIHVAAEQVGVTRAQLKSTNTNTEDIQHFYESLGYRVWYVQMYK
jgi:ribosomal protein S18 acetylase RimI-like enzyme